jgi:predicted metal-dependent peptidase
MSQVKPKYDFDELHKDVKRVKIRFMQQKNTTFFSALLANLDLQITEEGFPPHLKTACTNGLYLKLHPEFITGMPKEQLMGLILHEVLHVAFDHIIRCYQGKYNHKIWNIAGDHYINLMILAMGYQLPPKGYHDSCYKKMSTQQIYDILIKNPPPDLNKFHMDLIPAPPGMSDKEHKHKVTGNVIKAIAQAKMRNDPGSIPGGLERRLEKVLRPKLPWQALLHQFMQPYSKSDYSWSRPNRRYMPDFYLPHMKGEQLKQITTGIDVSGSMTIYDLQVICPEVQYIWDTLQPEKMRLQTFDTRVHLDELYSEGDTLDLVKLKGGGGTNVVPLLASIRKENPEVALIFTDGYFPKPDMTGIDTNILWIIKNNPNFTNPIGEIIHLN